MWNLNQHAKLTHFKPDKSSPFVQVPFLQVLSEYKARVICAYVSRVLTSLQISLPHFYKRFSFHPMCFSHQHPVLRSLAKNTHRETLVLLQFHSLLPSYPCWGPTCSVIAAPSLANLPSHQNDPVCVHRHFFSPHQEQYVSRFVVLQEALQVLQKLRYAGQVLVREVRCRYPGPHNTVTNHKSSRLTQPCQVIVEVF